MSQLALSFTSAASPTPVVVAALSLCGCHWHATFQRGGQVLGSGIVQVFGTRAQAIASARRIATRLATQLAA